MFVVVLLFYITGLQRPLLPSSQLLEQSGLLSQGMTAVVRISSQFMHQATIWVKSKQLRPQPSRRVSRVKRNTPGFILEHFIVHSAYSGRPPSGGVLSLTVMTIVTHIKYTAKSAAKNPAKCTINKSYNHVSSYCYNCSTLLR